MIIKMNVQLHLDDNYIDVTDKDDIDWLKRQLTNPIKNRWHNMEMGDFIGHIEVTEFEIIT